MAVPARKRRTRAAAQAAPAPAETLQGRITRVVFSNPENGYTVLRFRPEGAGIFDEVTAVGYFANLRTDDEYRLAGEWKEHPKFGRQFVVAEHELILPSSRKGIIAYLCSIGTGIGEVKAGRIVDALGEDCLEKIKADPAVLLTVKGVTQEQAEEIHTALAGNAVLAELSALICREGITPNLAAKIYAQYGADSVRVVKENPYVLAEDVFGIGFLTADKVASAVGIEADNPHRVEAVVEYVLREAANGEGHCYLLPSQIVAAVYDLLGKACGISVDDMAEAVKRLQESGRLVREGDCIYRRDLYEAEQAVARRLGLLAEGVISYDVQAAKALLETIQERDGIEYAPEQVEAVLTALGSPVSIVTGGPGTGKTTVVNALLEIWRTLHEEEGYVYLASPTGRAAKRMEEVTGYEARTIHRLLEYHPFGGFRVNEDEPLAGPGLLVVDEVSMMDVELARHLLVAVPPNVQLVLVGDVDQLPSVGPGSVLRDCIQSGAIPTVRLRFNYRQAGGSKVAEYAHRIVNGRVPPLRDDGDWEVRLVATPEEAADKVLAEVARARAEGYGAMDIQVLCPQKRGSAGVDALNRSLRELLNPATDDRPDYRGRFRVGDKVMVVKNDYQRGVFNGDLGLVADIVSGAAAGGEEGEGVVVDFDGSRVHFAPDALGELTLAYACTVHKSQGSEFPVVVEVCTRQSYIMLQRNLLYTGVTRAKHRHVLVCQEDAVRRAVENDRIAERNSRLAGLLRGDIQR